MGSGTVLGEGEKLGYKCINARAETVATTPAFQDPYTDISAAAWCPPVASINGRRRPRGMSYYITSADETLLAFAGLWDNWRKPEASA